eukprot:544624_1
MAVARNRLLISRNNRFVNYYTILPIAKKWKRNDLILSTQLAYSNSSDSKDKLNWKCKHTWRESSINTSWCLLGCSIGDFGTMIVGSHFFPAFIAANPMTIMAIATVNGLLTSIALETGILYHRNKKNDMKLQEAFKTAMGMSLISMISMETAMNITDYIIVGTASVTWYSIVPSMIMGFIVPLPYNYWRLKKFGKACH